MKTIALIMNIIAIFVFFTGCNNRGKKEMFFEVKKAFTCNMDTIRDFNVAKIINNRYQVNTQHLKSKTPVTFSDLQIMRDTLFKFRVEPSSNAKGLTISGLVTFVYNNTDKISSVFFYSQDKKRLFVWPDEYATLVDLKNEDTEFLIDKFFCQLPMHWVNHLAYMAFPEKPEAIKLELHHSGSIYMLGENECEESHHRFDISGLTGKDGKIYCIADKVETPDIYQVDTCSDGNFYITRAVKTNIKTPELDIEVVDVYDNRFVISDEIHDLLYFQNNNNPELFEPLEIDFTVLGEDMKLWGKRNAGIEGMTIDNKNKLIYIAKERDPRRVFVYDIKTGQLSAPFDDVILPSDGDISDMCCEGKYLYILDRQNCFVRRLDVKTKESKYASFVKYSTDRVQNNYLADFGMAEALWLTKDAIFIGFDNNNDLVSEYGEKIGLKKGSCKPSIFVFKRPAGF
ncbi:MAG: SdiA-regulated domain-containing protein [Bacteroidales bacterium]|nr:SdiA-regulated domain-containing protein [Bacteroidales bacterium]